MLISHERRVKLGFKSVSGHHSIARDNNTAQDTEHDTNAHAHAHAHAHTVQPYALGRPRKLYTLRRMTVALCRTYIVHDSQADERRRAQPRGQSTTRTGMEVDVDRPRYACALGLLLLRVCTPSSRSGRRRRGALDCRRLRGKRGEASTHMRTEDRSEALVQ